MLAILFFLINQIINSPLKKKKKQKTGDFLGTRYVLVTPEDMVTA